MLLLFVYLKKMGVKLVRRTNEGDGGGERVRQLKERPIG